MLSKFENGLNAAIDNWSYFTWFFLWFKLICSSKIQHTLNNYLLFYDYWILFLSADKAIFWGMFGQFNHNFGQKICYFLSWIHYNIHNLWTILIYEILYFRYWEHFMIYLFINNMKYLWKTLGNVKKNLGHMSLLTNTKNS